MKLCLVIVFLKICPMKNSFLALQNIVETTHSPIKQIKTILLQIPPFKTIIYLLS